MTGSKLTIHVLTDSETLFSVMIKSTSTSELRLMIDIKSAKEWYERDEISTIAWIRRRENLSDAMTKIGVNNELMNFMHTNELKYTIDQSVARVNNEDKSNPAAELINSINASNNCVDVNQVSTDDNNKISDSSQRVSSSTRVEERDGMDVIITSLDK